MGVMRCPISSGVRSVCGLLPRSARGGGSSAAASTGSEGAPWQARDVARDSSSRARMSARKTCSCLSRAGEPEHRADSGYSRSFTPRF